jgi:hypothetical protein
LVLPVPTLQVLNCSHAGARDTPPQYTKQHMLIQQTAFLKKIMGGAVLMIMSTSTSGGCDYVCVTLRDRLRDFLRRPARSVCY